MLRGMFGVAAGSPPGPVGVGSSMGSGNGCGDGDGPLPRVLAAGGTAATGVAARGAAGTAATGGGTGDADCCCCRADARVWAGAGDARADPPALAPAPPSTCMPAAAGLPTAEANGSGGTTDGPVGAPSGGYAAGSALPASAPALASAADAGPDTGVELLLRDSSAGRPVPLPGSTVAADTSGGTGPSRNRSTCRAGDGGIAAVGGGTDPTPSAGGSPALAVTPAGATGAASDDGGKAGAGSGGAPPTSGTAMRSPSGRGRFGDTRTGDGGLAATTTPAGKPLPSPRLGAVSLSSDELRPAQSPSASTRSAPRSSSDSTGGEARAAGSPP